MSDADQKHHLAHGIGDILIREHRFGHACEARELVHHAFDIVDLTHDRLGTLFEDRGILGNRFAVFATQPFG